MIIEFDKKYLFDIYKLGSLLNRDYSRLYDEESLNNGVNKTFLCVENEKLIGFVHIQDLIDEIDIINIVVSEENRRKGYASKLIEYVINYANNRKIILEVSDQNVNAINLYKKYNFIEINRRKGYYNGIDAIIMEKK
ncbi:MAG: GNAT family N-acetyltransferase [Bacilli bacterium]|nr:GNAT family N-acetyltransferase [Bacilli bacterium]